MADRPVDLDEHRGMAAQKSTKIRRRLREVQADQAALRHRQEEFERDAVAAPSMTWPEVAEKARYLIQLFAATPEARYPRRQMLIATVLDDLARLSSEAGQRAKFDRLWRDEIDRSVRGARHRVPELDKIRRSRRRIDGGTRGQASGRKNKRKRGTYRAMRAAYPGSNAGRLFVTRGFGWQDRG